ncbi:TetR/AcrR family transcriptional regulator C-terminal domain-containing protein [Kibdelosporangium phytohabitans]|uniref:TetR/AcrR family transcriptional regulator C-terminal domain-containing protein n=1 Tax=Kibdelosporangium phytohabitans TaxID=860235 RepID=UPI000A928A07|nr:TetR/AcrR family transcriptional regulator C-terminal domain-containing protein [Kibdelosporangium phytohabitans]MBE1462941.1 AcrR family transcriptional regulator [Kibdelosporangium phytohabitans]
MSRYLTIADELKRRITTGELPPGAKVPSTRKIAAEWGVAMATAAKALAALSQEGLVRAEPRSGTVVTGAPKAQSAPRATAAPRSRAGRAPELTRERVVRAAIVTADAEGLGALSMRGVAARLAVAPMALYKHVASKEELVVLMADAAYGERGYPASPPEGWRARLELSARTMWSLYRRHPWLAQLAPITRPMPLPNLATHAEFILSALDGHGLGAAKMCDLHVLLFSYVQGVAIHLEREQQAAGSSGLSEDDWMDAQAPALETITGDGRFPTFARMLNTLAAEGYDLVLDNLFELGLKALLDGIDLSG